MATQPRPPGGRQPGVGADDPVQGWNFNTWYVRAWTVLPAAGADGADRGRSWWATESSGGTAEVTVDAVTSTAAGGIVVTTIAT